MPKLPKGKTVVIAAVIALVLLLAWYQGGERPRQLVEQDVPVPESAQ